MGQVNLAVSNIPLKEIHEDDNFNCRGKILPTDVIDLTKDIERQGLIQPIILAPYPEDKQKILGKKYRLIAGYRRYTAFKILQKVEIPAIIREDMVNDVDARFFNLQENLQRKNLNIMQEAISIEKLKEIGIGEYEAAERLGFSRGWVQVRYMLLELPKEVQAEVLAGSITQPQIRELYTMQNRAGPDACLRAAKDIKEARARGRVISINEDVKKDTKARIRKRMEIFDMMDHMRETVGNGLWTRALAWAAGEINNLEFQESIKLVCEKLGKTYVPPKVRDYTMDNGDNTVNVLKGNKG